MNKMPCQAEALPTVYKRVKFKNKIIDKHNFIFYNFSEN